MDSDRHAVEDPAAEAMRRVYDPVTYTTPLFHSRTEVYTIPLHLANTDDTITEIRIEEIELDCFLNTFSVREKTEEIVEIMGHTPRLKALFEDLVPTVISYPDFWTRFYFRCDPDRIRRIQIWEATSSISSQESDGVDKRRSETTLTISSPTSIVDHLELDGLHILRNLSLEGL